MMNNGHPKGYFLLKRGTRQGEDPLSAYLFYSCIGISKPADCNWVDLLTDQAVFTIHC